MRHDRPLYPRLEDLHEVLERRPDFLRRAVTVTEKVGGQLVRVGRDELGVLWYGARSSDHDVNGPRPAEMEDFRSHCRASFRLLPAGLTLYGKWLDGDFVLVGEKFAGAPVMSSTAVLDQHWLNGVTTVPVIYEGSSAREDVLRELGKVESVIRPGTPIGGVVIAPLEPVFEGDMQVIAKIEERE